MNLHVNFTNEFFIKYYNHFIYLNYKINKFLCNLNIKCINQIDKRILKHTNHTLSRAVKWINSKILVYTLLNREVHTEAQTLLELFDYNNR